MIFLFRNLHFEIPIGARKRRLKNILAIASGTKVCHLNLRTSLKNMLWPLVLKLGGSDLRILSFKEPCVRTIICLVFCLVSGFCHHNVYNRYVYILSICPLCLMNDTG
uniref:Uncharacterized protein n=1 Tax=Cacopsylla melanoneura TaxID=428564 RepID=A0A8D9BUS4_9HEMI